jgi:hypothetical protein
MGRVIVGRPKLPKRSRSSSSANPRSTSSAPRSLRRSTRSIRRPSASRRVEASPLERERRGSGRGARTSPASLVTAVPIPIDGAVRPAHRACRPGGRVRRRPRCLLRRLGPLPRDVCRGLCDLAPLRPEPRQLADRLGPSPGPRMRRGHGHSRAEAARLAAVPRQLEPVRLASRRAGAPPTFPQPRGRAHVRRQADPAGVGRNGRVAQSMSSPGLTRAAGPGCSRR